MQAIQNVIYVVSSTYDFRYRVIHDDIPTIVRTVDGRGKLSAHEIVDMVIYERYFTEVCETVSWDVRRVLDVIGRDWVEEHPVNAANIVKAMCECDLNEGIAAIESYLKETE